MDKTINLLRGLINSIKEERNKYSTDPGFDDGVHMSIKTVEKFIKKLEKEEKWI